MVLFSGRVGAKLCVKRGREIILRFLLLPQERKGGYSLLHIAVKQADTELLTHLLQVPSISVNLTTYNRQTALDLADMLRRRDMIRQLTVAGGLHTSDYVPDSGSESDDVS